MITANELRIGNILKAQLYPDKPDERVIVLQIEKDGVCTGWHYENVSVTLRRGYSKAFKVKEFVPYHALHPVELNVEVLHELGFYLTENNYWETKDFDIQVFINQHPDGRINYHILRSYNHVAAILHLHELQNVYFILFGKELVKTHAKLGYGLEIIL